MSEKQVKTRIVHKHDFEKNWEQAINFRPKRGELIIYDVEIDESGNILAAATIAGTTGHLNNAGRTIPYNYERFKIGDGTSTVNELPFATTADTEVRLSEPFIITQDFGYYTLGNGQSSKTVGEAGQTLHSFLQGALAAEDRTIFSTAPSFSITIYGETEGEIGATVTPTANFTNNAGTYCWGTMNGTTPDYSTKNTGISYTNGSITATSGAIGQTLTYKAAGQTVSVKGTSTRSAVTKHPISNIGTDIYDNLAAEYKSNKTNSNVTASKTFTGYRKMFMGAIDSTETVNGPLIRRLLNTNYGFKASTMTNRVVSAKPEDTKIIWAIPSSFINKASNFKIKFEYEPAANDWQILTNAGIENPQTIKIAGAGEDTGEDYQVYICAPVAGGTFGGKGLNTRVTITTK